LWFECWCCVEDFEISSTLYVASVDQTGTFVFAFLSEFHEKQFNVALVVVTEDRFEDPVIEERRRTAQDLLNFVGQRNYLTNSVIFKQFFQVLAG